MFGLVIIICFRKLVIKCEQKPGISESFSWVFFWNSYILKQLFQAKCLIGKHSKTITTKQRQRLQNKTIFFHILILALAIWVIWDKGFICSCNEKNLPLPSVLFLEPYVIHREASWDQCLWFSDENWNSQSKGKNKFKCIASLLTRNILLLGSSFSSVQENLWTYSNITALPCSASRKTAYSDGS